MTERIKAILDAVTDRVFAYRPADKGQQAKKIERRVKRQRKKEDKDDRESSIQFPKIKPCPHCGVSMQGLEKTFYHPGVVGDDSCINNGKSFYWRYLKLWNTRAGEAEADNNA